MRAVVPQLPEFLRELLTSDVAFVVLFVVFVLEGAMLLYIAPSELLVPGALVLIGEEYLLPILAIAVAGATVGQYGLFLVAKYGGREYLLSRSWFRLDESKLDRFDGWFERWGPLVVPASNAMLFTRGMLTVPAGFAEMSSRRFLVLSAAGTLVFETALAVLFVFGGRVVG
ncbi:DedA family protein [Haloferax profundi]|uniref:SNARE associated golgi family protein n=1 Tax=Haloferax profundi TaxID=1544718 RepID=A0A0W1SSQ0_9EURY|nr:VTT domain-containing protein [Haloferax profundi]KTG29331.1 SNARE associated golgi family protein [Haloferax profundi]